MEVIPRLSHDAIGRRAADCAISEDDGPHAVTAAQA
jgi:hypothetical protein